MKTKVWLQALRAYSFPASFIPLLFGIILAFKSNNTINWYLLLPLTLAILFSHAGTNLINDYYDYLKGVDKKDTLGSSRVLVDNLLTPQQVLIASWILFALAFIFSLPLIYMQGLTMFFLLLGGFCLGYFYSGSPIGYKYFALGEPLVFLSMGPLIVLVAFFALTGTYNLQILLSSLPIGFMVAAILSGNNLRDIEHDNNAKIKTLAIILGCNKAKLLYRLLILSAFTSVLILVIYNFLTALSLLVFLTLPVAFKLIKEGNLKLIDVKTAQLHLLFGLLLCVSVLFGK